MAEKNKKRVTQKKQSMHDVSINGKRTVIEKNKKKAICVMGMHRSGTSVITRAINFLGVYLGEQTDMIASFPDNPEGFWERNDINLIHERILDTFKQRWDTVEPLPQQWHISAKMRPIWWELTELVKRKFSKHKLWGFKDPRTALLLDVWRDVLKELRTDLACLYVIRNPIDVAKSLETRDGIPHDKSFGIWFNYNITALNDSSSVQRVFISYDRFLNDWEVELKRCAHGLGITWPKEDKELRENIKEYIRPGLRHSKSKTDDMKKLDIPDPVIALYKLLEGVTNRSTKPDASFVAKVKSLSHEYSSYARFFHNDMAQLWECRQNIIKLNQKLTEREEQLADRNENEKMLFRYNDRLKKIDKAITRIEDIKHKEDEMKQRDERIKVLEKNIKERDAVIAKINKVSAQNEDELKQRDERIKVLEENIKECDAIVAEINKVAVQKEDEIKQKEEILKQQQEFIDKVRNSLAYKIYDKTIKPLKIFKQQ